MRSLLHLAAALFTLSSTLASPPQFAFPLPEVDVEYPVVPFPDAISSHEIQRAWRYRSSSNLGGQQPSRGVLERTIDLPSRQPALGWAQRPASVSSDGELLVYAIGDEMRVYSLTAERYEGQLVRVLDAGCHLDTVAFHPVRPRQLVSACSDYEDLDGTPAKPEVAFWDLEERHEVKIDSVNGRLVGSFGAEVWDHAGERIVYLPGSRPQGGNWPPGREPQVWEVAIYELATGKSIKLDGTHADAIMWARFSPDGSKVATAAWDQTFQVWDAATGKKEHTFRTAQQNWAAAFSPDSKRLAGTSGDGKLFVWDLESGEKLLERTMENAWNRAVSFSPDGAELLVGEEDEGKVLILDSTTGEEKARRQLDMTSLPEKYRGLTEDMFGITHVEWHTDDGTLAYSTTVDNSVEIFDPATNKLVRLELPKEDLSKREQMLMHFERVGGGRWVTVDTKRISIWSV